MPKKHVHLTNVEVKSAKSGTADYALYMMATASADLH